MSLSENLGNMLPRIVSISFGYLPNKIGSKILHYYRIKLRDQVNFLELEENHAFDLTQSRGLGLVIKISVSCSDFGKSGQNIKSQNVSCSILIYDSSNRCTCAM